MSILTKNQVRTLTVPPVTFPDTPENAKSDQQALFAFVMGVVADKLSYEERNAIVGAWVRNESVSHWDGWHKGYNAAKN